MALVPVRSKQPVDGDTFVTEVGEEWLERWPDDFDRLEGEELVRYQLGKSGLNFDEIEAAVAAKPEPAPEAPAVEPVPAPEVDDSLDATVAEEPTVEPDPAPAAPQPIAYDPTASSD